ncbi:transcriptional repressor [Candidatus Woesebacteria bacterium]|nr:transcriptional repressor [Candidatus Woesebacteria bacterium]
MKTNHLEEIKGKGHRITQARASILELFENTDRPIEAKALHTMLTRIGVQVNVTTVYREIEFLLKENIIEKVPLKDTELHYEMKGRPHHHHLMCTDCGKIEDMTLESEKNLLEEAHTLSKYHIKRHSIAFFGKCPTCQ